MRYIAGFVLSTVCMVPALASADQIADLQAQVQVLSQLLQQLQQQKALAAPSSTSTTCAALTTSLDPGASGTAVMQLQQFLARDVSIYPEGKVTGYYGPLTTAAVQRFQAQNGIISSGTPAATGYGRVGPKTLSAIKSQCASDTVGAFMQVSPDEGRAPLQVSIQVTVNTTNNCAAGLYKLDFGDQTPPQQILVPTNTCQPLQQTYIHTYQKSAAYEVVLSSGPHSTQASVIAQP